MVIGLCGGYQMLGQSISDPGGTEGPPETRNGLGLLNVNTVMGGEKTLVETQGLEVLSGAPVRGYEIHMGNTTGEDRNRPWFTVRGHEPEGACSSDGLVMGSYLHGMFVEDVFRQAFLSRLRAGHHSDLAFEDRIEKTLDGLAAHLEQHMDLDKLLRACNRQIESF